MSKSLSQLSEIIAVFYLSVICIFLAIISSQIAKTSKYVDIYVE